MDNQIDAMEAEQLKTLQIYRKLVQGVLLRHKFILLFIFLVGFGCVMAIIQRIVAKSPTRYTAKTSLIYYPKRTSKIGSIDENQVLRIFSRRLMINKLSENRPPVEGNNPPPPHSIEIRQEWKQKNLFIITAHSSDKTDAINTVNLMADLCIKEYVAYRIEDLNKWSETVNMRKKELSEAIKKLEDEIANLTRQTGITDPENELDRIKGTITHLKNTHTDLLVQLSSAKANQSNLMQMMKDIDQNALLNIDKLRTFEADIKKADDEITLLHQRYTDSNPKVSVVIDRKNEIIQKYNDFIKEKNIKNFNLEILGMAVKLQDKLQNALVTLESLNERIKIVESEIKASEEMANSLGSVIPHITEISHERNSLQKSFKDLDDDTSAINYLLASVKNDMSQVERCESASGQNPFSIRNVVIAFIAGMACMGFAAILLSFTEIVFGTVQNLAELQAYPELNALGAIPASMKSFTSSNDARTVLDSIFYNFEQIDAPKKVVFLGSLPGAKYLDFLQEAMNWNYGMSGKRLLLVKIVNGDSFKEPEEGEGFKELGAVFYSEMSGTMPVENLRTLTPSEMLLLQNDLQNLQKEFDTIFISRDDPIDNYGVFFKQMLNISDSAIILVGANRSPRSSLRYAVSEQHETNRCIMTILTNSKDAVSRRA